MFYNLVSFNITRGTINVYTYPMKISLKSGLSFGLASGILTTLGLLVGLSSSTQSKLAVIGGIVTIAIADALSDAFGMHLSKESESQHSGAHVWESAFSTFVAKFVFALIFVIPVVLLDLKTAVAISLVLGTLLLILASVYIAKKNNDRVLPVVFEHLSLGFLVVFCSYLVGKAVNNVFG